MAFRITNSDGGGLALSLTMMPTRSLRCLSRILRSSPQFPTGANNQSAGTSDREYPVSSLAASGAAASSLAGAHRKYDQIAAGTAIKAD